MSSMSSFTCSFPIWMPLFLFLVAFLWLRLLVEDGESEQFCLAPDHRGNLFQTLTTVYNVSWGFSKMSFTVLRKLSSISTFMSAFIMKVCWIVLNTFCLSIEIIMKFFSPFILFMCCILLIHFQMLNHFCNPGMNESQDSVWILFSSILLSFWI